MYVHTCMYHLKYIAYRWVLSPRIESGKSLSACTYVIKKNVNDKTTIKSSLGAVLLFFLCVIFS